MLGDRDDFKKYKASVQIQRKQKLANPAIDYGCKFHPDYIILVLLLKNPIAKILM